MERQQPRAAEAEHHGSDGQADEHDPGAGGSGIGLLRRLRRLLHVVLREQFEVVVQALGIGFDLRGREDSADLVALRGLVEHLQPPRHDLLGELLDEEEEVGLVLRFDGGPVVLQLLPGELEPLLRGFDRPVPLAGLRGEQRPFLVAGARVEVPDSAERVLHAERVDPVHPVGAAGRLFELVDADGRDDRHQAENDDEPAQDLMDQAEVRDSLRNAYEPHELMTSSRCSGSSPCSSCCVHHRLRTERGITGGSPRELPGGHYGAAGRHRFAGAQHAPRGPATPYTAGDGGTAALARAHPARSAASRGDRHRGRPRRRARAGRVRRGRRPSFEDGPRKGKGAPLSLKVEGRWIFLGPTAS